MNKQRGYADLIIMMVGVLAIIIILGGWWQSAIKHQERAEERRAEKAIQNTPLFDHNGNKISRKYFGRGKATIVTGDVEKAAVQELEAHLRTSLEKVQPETTFYWVTSWRPALSEAAQAIEKLIQENPSSYQILWEVSPEDKTLTGGCVYFTYPDGEVGKYPIIITAVPFDCLFKHRDGFGVS